MVRVEFRIDGRVFEGRAYWEDFQSSVTLPYWAGDLPPAIRHWAGLEGPK